MCETAAETEMQTSVFLEIRKKTQSGHLILGGPGMESSTVDVSVTPLSILLKTAKHCENIDLPAGVSILPSSCQKLLHFARDSLCLRLQVQTDCNTEFVPTAIESVKAQKSYSFYCQSCKEAIINQREFLRVLPLPSGGWNDVVGEWCCHPDPFANRKLLPRENDCLLGDTFLLVNSGSVCDSVIWEPKMDPQLDSSVPKCGTDPAQKGKENARIICKRCRLMVGETISPETIKLYITELMILPTCEEFSKINVEQRFRFVEGVVARRLAELSTTRSTFRFSIQGHDGTTCVLLWLLNSDTLLVGNFRNSASGSILNAVGDGAPSCRQTSYEAKSAVKVLYHPCLKSENKDVVDAWEKDIGVHSLTLPSETCSELLLILSSSTASLPPSLRSMNSFQVAFLKL